MKKISSEQTLTPMMAQFFLLKEENPGFILFFRLGDFYEMFDQDALICSKILGLTLTKRQQFDMCGIPHHAKNNYIHKLISANYKVAMCEQVEMVINNKKTFDRRVTELLTPGTFHSDGVLQKSQNQFLMSLIPTKTKYYYALSDITTGKSYTGEVSSQTELLAQIYKFSPTEIIFTQKDKEILTDIAKNYYYSLIELPNIRIQEEFLKSHFRIQSLTSLGLIDASSISAVYSCLQYLKHNLFKDIYHMNHLEKIQSNDIMTLSETTIKNLEILEAQNTYHQKNNSLLSHINQTETSMGARYLKHLVVHPSINKAVIEERLEVVSYFVKNPSNYKSIKQLLSQIPDIERLLSKISLAKANPKDIWSLQVALTLATHIIKETPDILAQDISYLENILTLTEEIQNTITENPPIEFGDNPVILDSYSEELAQTRKKALQSFQIILDIEKQEQEKNKLPKLRIKYNKILGYYIEIPKGASHRVPDYFIRKQSLVNLERFTINELISFEQEVLTAKDNLLQIEKQAFKDLCHKILNQIQPIQQYIELIKNLDVYTCFAHLSIVNQYTKPIITHSDTLSIKEGRHPVVETLTPIFSSNNTLLNDTVNRLLIISGPNMAGKSTFLRQTALIVLMAHIGCFVPASYAEIPITDQIFTRIGASDNLSKGESTFLVEMSEAAAILNFTTPRSLIIMDEIGRGTSTYDGLSLAWAIIEYLAQEHTLRGKTLFATHYHELAELENQYSTVKNYRMAIKESKNKIIFLHKVEKGAADQSYGIHVAALAGLPTEIISRANSLLALFTKTHQNTNAPTIKLESLPMKPLQEAENSFLSTDLEKILLKIQRLDMNQITGLDALKIINDIKKYSSPLTKKKSDETIILF